MKLSTAAERRQSERLDPESLAAHQLARLNRLLDRILPQNDFYAEKLAGIGPSLHSLDQLGQLPFTFKDELATRHSGKVAANLTYPPERYVRFHQTSGTRGRPLSVLDTAEDWQCWLDCWQYVLDAAEITDRDTVLATFSFGPFIGFWSGFEAAAARGCLVVPSGGMSSLARLELIHSSAATCVLCTPSYALHLAEVAEGHNIDLSAAGVRRLVLSGEPGGSVPAVRKRIEAAWGAAVLDHAGATEVGPWGYGDLAGRGLYVLETEFIAEFLSVTTGTAAADGELAELVLTPLSRFGCPLVRYRTGDLVRPTWSHSGENRFVMLEGGVLGRADDMTIIRGVNIFPSSVEQILRSFPEVVEFRLTASKQAEMDRLAVEIEDRLDEPSRVAEELRLRLGLKIEVRSVPLGSLPRYEGKGRRFVDRRGEADT